MVDGSAVRVWPCVVVPEIVAPAVGKSLTLVMATVGALLTVSVFPKLSV